MLVGKQIPTKKGLAGVFNKLTGKHPRAGRVWDRPESHSRVGIQVWDGCPGSSGCILAHLPTFLKLGLFQGRMHQTKLGLDSVWEVKVQRPGLEHPPQGLALQEK